MGKYKKTTTAAASAGSGHCVIIAKKGNASNRQPCCGNRSFYSENKSHTAEERTKVPAEDFQNDGLGSEVS